MNTKWIIWSNEHNAWWNPNEAGYTRSKTAAGRYSFERAKEICDSANEFTGDKPNETMLPVDA